MAKKSTKKSKTTAAKLSRPLIIATKTGYVIDIVVFSFGAAYFYQQSRWYALTWVLLWAALFLLLLFAPERPSQSLTTRFDKSLFNLFTARFAPFMLIAIPILLTTPRTAPTAILLCLILIGVFVIIKWDDFVVWWYTRK